MNTSSKRINETAKFLTHDEETKMGHEIAELLGLKKDDRGHYVSTVAMGTKSAAGLVRTLLRVMEESAKTTEKSPSASRRKEVSPTNKTLALDVRESKIKIRPRIPGETALRWYFRCSSMKRFRRTNEELNEGLSLEEAAERLMERLSRAGAK